MLSTTRVLIVAAGVMLLGGCAAITTEDSLPAEHPANATASEAPLPAPSRTLALDPSVLPPAPANDSALGMQHEMQHGASDAGHGSHDMHHAGHGSPTQTSSTRPGEHAAPSARRVTPATVPSTTAATVYTCPMHKEIVTSQPSNCPKCGMKLVPRAPARPADHSGHGGHQ